MGKITVFKNHIVICNWNRRGKTVIKALRAFSDQPVLIICQDVNVPISEVGNFDGVFVLAGDPTTEISLRTADVTAALSVLILASENLGDSADAESVKIALLVEQMEVNVYTVVELLDIANRSHFAWTKVDDLVADQDLAIRLMAQGIRHLVATNEDEGSSPMDSANLMEVYEQLVNPFKGNCQLFKIYVPIEAVSDFCFQDILAVGLYMDLLPTALMGYVKHEIKLSDNGETWASWKIDVQANPESDAPIASLWPEWPGQYHQLGIVLFAKDHKSALSFGEALKSRTLAI